MAGSAIEGIEDVVDELLAISPPLFTEARNAAAKRLRAEGRKDAADTVKGLPRPPLSLWALNRLAREQAASLETFLRAADDLRKAHRSGGDIRAATPPEREAEARVVAAAAELVRAEGTNVTETVLRGLRQTLSAAAAHSEVATELRAGRLIREPQAPSIDELLASLPQEPAAAKPKAPPRRDRDKERRAVREEIAAAKADATRARREARAAADAERAAQREWERAQKLAERTQRSSDAADERVQELEQRLEEL